MKRTLITLSVLSLAALPAFADEDADRRAAESRAVAIEFMNTLKGELQAAMKAGGPPNAITVCKDKAPVIAAEKSAATGYSVGQIRGAFTIAQPM